MAAVAAEVPAAALGPEAAVEVVAAVEVEVEAVEVEVVAVEEEVVAVEPPEEVAAEEAVEVEAVVAEAGWPAPPASRARASDRASDAAAMPA